MQLESKPRYRCRNPRCRGKLKEPADNPRNAFCCRGCHASYYRSRCLVCERSYERAREDQHTCGRRKCKSALRYHKAQFFGKWADVPAVALSPLKNPIKPGIKTRDAPEREICIGPAQTKSLRGWYWAEPKRQEPEDVIERRFLYDRSGRLASRIVQEGEGWWVAYPGMTPEPPIEPLQAAIKRAETVALWALPLDSATVQRIRAANRAVWRRSPVTKLQQTETPSGIVSRWEPSPTQRDCPDIPEFLRRTAQQPLPAMEQSPPLVPAEQPESQPAEVSANA